MITTCPNCGWASPDGGEILRCAKCGWTKEFMEYDEFARLMGTSGCTVRRWVKAGRIKATRFGPRLIRIHRSEFNRLAGLPPEKQE